MKLAPCFEQKAVVERGDLEMFQRWDGTLVLRHKFMISIPKPLKHGLVDRESWRKDYKPRLDPDYPDRYPKDWDVIQ